MDEPLILGARTLSASFTDFLQRTRPDLMPQSLLAAIAGVPHGTTILATRFAEGVVVAGDRRMTAGYSIEHGGVEKVFPTDNYSAVAISGAAGPSVELVRLFQTELEFYEKVEGEPLSLEGRANFLGRLIRGNLPAAMQGLVVLPIFAGYDMSKMRGRIFQYDVTGGRFEETDYHATGSGGPHAKDTLKKSFRRAEDLDRSGVIRLALEALADAAEEDAATAGPDPVHGIYPTVYTIGTEGVARVPDDEIETVSRSVIADRTVQTRR
jgi:proteasome beta subunit